ncbi:hypothetical protein D5952_14235 [Salmonella enterica subsp. enterica]|nr:hypothetical protein [Salmonella enterica subsp. enterica serovar Bonn]EBZ5939340.1 hypothetical protein [Salmonella enterica subsp. enterica serovar Muenchen]MLZ41083.1 hypothetical protein [Salmonella enterica subsp. enterica serovar Bonn]
MIILLFRALLIVIIASISWNASATNCETKDYSPTLKLDKTQADASLVPATGKVPFAEGTFRIYLSCTGGYSISGYMLYNGDTNLASEGITYKLYTSAGVEIPYNKETKIGTAPQNGQGSKKYIIDTTLKIKFFREETSRRLTWSGLREITQFGTNRLRVVDARNVVSTFANSIPLTPIQQVKAQRCKVEKVNTMVDLGTVIAGKDGEYVPFSIGLVNCPARTNPEYWGMRVFIDDPNSAESNTSLLRPATDSVSGYGVEVDVENKGSFTPMKFNAGDAATLLTLSNYDYTSGTTSINFRAILKKNGDKIEPGQFKATGNLHIVFN